MKKIIKNILRNFGFELRNTKYRNKFNLENTFNRLIKKLDSGQKFIVFDVGGNLGEFSKFYIKLFEHNEIKNYDIHYFEPNTSLLEMAKKKISSNKVIYNNFGLGEKDQTLDFYIHRDRHMNSSFLDVHTSYYDIYKKKGMHKYEINKVKRQITSIDNYIKQKNIPYIDILKIDTQGFNENVIAGSVKSLEDEIIKLIYTEITLGYKYKKKETFYNFEKFLIKNNYSLFGIDTKFYDVQIISKFLYKDLTLDFFYINNKYDKI